MEVDPVSRLAVTALQNLINDSEIRMQSRVHLYRLWEAMCSENEHMLKTNGWIINCSLETVEFYVYNTNDILRWIPNHKVHAQPGEKIEVHGNIFQKKYENMVVKKDNRGIAYNIKKNGLHLWTGSAMVELLPSIEYFRSKFRNQGEQQLLQRNMNVF